jgi:hypothetical protein
VVVDQAVQVVGRVDKVFKDKEIMVDNQLEVRVEEVVVQRVQGQMVLVLDAEELEEEEIRIISLGLILHMEVVVVVDVCLQVKK